MTVTTYVLGTVLAASVAALAGVVAVRLVPRASSRLRQGLLHAALALVILAPLAPPLAQLVGAGWASTSLTASPAPQGPNQLVRPGEIEVTPDAPRATARPASTAASDASSARPREPELRTDAAGGPRAALSPASIWWALALGAWCLGTAWRVLRLAQDQRRLAAVTARSQPARPALRDRVRAAADRVGLETAPDLLTAPVSVPFSVAARWGRTPTIYLPPRSTQLAPKALDAVLVHECGHFAHRHHRVGRLLEGARLAFWWNPLVRALCAAIRDVHEDVADDHVLRAAQIPARDYARMLVDLAERAVHTESMPHALGAIALLPRGTGTLTRRVRSLIDPRRRPVTTLTHRGAGATAALSALAAFSMLFAVPAQDPQRAETQSSAREPVGDHYLPLAVGGWWRWQVARPGMAPFERRWGTMRRVTVSEGESCWEVRTLERDHVAWQYVDSRKHGVFVYPLAMLDGVRGVRRDSEPTRILATPIGTEMSWKWEVEAQDHAGVWTGGRDALDLPPDDEYVIHHVAELQGVHEAVEVPAGTFRAARVVTTGTSEKGSTVTTRWWAPDIGLVREVAKRNGTTLHEVTLLDYEPGFAPPVDRDAALARWMETNGLSDAPHKWLRNDSLERLFMSQFAVVGPPADKPDHRSQIVCVLHGTVTALDSRRTEDWQALFDREGFTRADDGSGLGSGSLAHGAACLEGFRLYGLADPALRVSMYQCKVSPQPDGATVLCNARVLHGDGTETPLRACFESVGAKITKAEVEEREPVAADRGPGGGLHSGFAPRR